MVATAAERAPATGAIPTERFSAATAHEAAGRIGALPARIRPAYDGAEIYGPAYPVLCPVGDNLWLHRAVAEASPGDVLVVQTTAGAEYGYWGEILSEAARARGLGGLVLDGGVRDVGALAHVGFPVFSSSICINGTIKDPDAPGRLGGPIRLGAHRIARGDVIVGDVDGVVVIPRDQWPEVQKASREREEKEAAIIAQIRSGASTLDLYSLPR
ncbi:4-carboxy-4-hydroxy-2-oxoadipate aldolase/oxaloacetate decarboxylase [Rhodococcoides corynebacterioides]|jgi:4-hydroxy-4-methyl-2-oxoglutarate aldolase|uniref:Putative 4-hydroxy-4-methyl-2-oxoglutarate aldolase n=1 Tax=Rhodococcoides corynebacterioides TaxID=53972 RepID=A0ABS7NYG4_9NOCA|nr:4-carboxy-4-hydroxy-2-oxoadipate aldolase/oxaloacetate decarboxylase [Rhodococcus corynebacterioides]MBY6365174.1 4-carboxy-4-hydroxy-2-oxoadipate aldolase/oxaloacetate decarboxylase [Rhodococcus corynebacterioides]MBY6406586.1 4-carboxy-4-hydroxy-2-oxoadipate aldolase/oxaloacetate decarboxylase [Rhodococcus corynebacterioides]